MSIADEIRTEQEREQISESEDAYLEFRRKIEPGLSNAGFDLVPAKSCDVESSKTGEAYKDQTLKSHILNGATFGTQINKALKEFDSAAALSKQELLEALLLFTSHDFHKTDKLQKKRQESERGLSDEDKDIKRKETEELVDKLGLNKFDTGLSVKDFRACALSAEEESGRHREVSSRKFDKYSEWVRLMDAAGSMQSPTEAKSLHKRLFKISDDVELHYHRFDDVRGISTNILNTAVSNLLSEESMEKVVFFENGVLYLSEKGKELSAQEYDGEEVTSAFMEELKESSNPLDDPSNIQKSLNFANQPKGYYEIENPSLLIFGLEKSLEGVRDKLETQVSNGSWGRYSAYEKALKAAAAEDLITEIPEYHKPQAVGIYLATVYQTIFQELNSDEYLESVRDLCNALDLEVYEILEEEIETEQPYKGNNLALARELVDTLGIEETELEEEISEINLYGDNKGGLKSFTQLLALVYIYGENSQRNSEKPVSQLLEDVEEKLLDYAKDQEERLAEEIDNAEDMENWEAFKQNLPGSSKEQVSNYISDNLQLNGSRPDQEISDEKYSKYTREWRGNASQGKICLRCNRAIKTEENAVSDYPNSGFSHQVELDASGGEPNQVICEVCNIERNLRRLVHEEPGDPENPSYYLLSAPDYFYSPVDIQIEKKIKEQIFAGGYDLMKAGASVIEKSKERSDIINSAMEVLQTAEEQEEWKNFLKNYDNVFDDLGPVGVYRIDTARGDGGEVNRTTHSFLSSYFSVVFSWATSSRVLLTDSAIPMLDFSDFNEMVKITGVPGSIKNTVNESVSISRLGDQDEWKEVRFKHLINKDTENSGVKREEVETVINTGLGYELYKLSALSYISNRRNGTDIQRVTDIVTDRENFTGANKLLKGSNAPTKDLNPIFSNRSSIDLRAADIFDTLVNSNMTNRIEKLAEAGFEAVHPNTKKKSNHEYERLFRVARDSLSDGLAKNASEEELIDIVAGDVMKSAARNEQDKDFAEESYKEDAAREFAEIFVTEIFEGLCEGDFYELRKMENRLASGYNAAIRRRSQEWFEEQNNGDSE